MLYHYLPKLVCVLTFGTNLLLLGEKFPCGLIWSIFIQIGLDLVLKSFVSLRLENGVTATIFLTNQPYRNDLFVVLQVVAKTGWTDQPKLT